MKDMYLVLEGNVWIWINIDLALPRIIPSAIGYMHNVNHKVVHPCRLDYVWLFYCWLSGAAGQIFSIVWIFECELLATKWASPQDKLTILHANNKATSVQSIRGSIGGAESGPPPPLKKHKNIRFRINTGPNPLNNHISCKHSILGHHCHADKTPFKWRFAGGPMMARFLWYLDPLISAFCIFSTQTRSKQVLCIDNSRVQGEDLTIIINLSHTTPGGLLP